ncbi:RNA-binding protein NOB1 [Stomoxys calcitrans]|uniref:RNA-binding protein NOB1 n=1 Tax=Stomoxys calcitrans TaxID=35570 RepID=UPI0027E37CB0|nr:RNA-binding protein NOB1 [Stomoxys calcitrans]
MSKMTENTKKIKYLIADTTAFINAVQLNDYAENILTVPDVVNEVRNKRQIRRLCVLPYDLQVREPRADVVKHCVEFAKKTGDYASLSGIDIKVIALTYELEADTVGTEHLRKEPVMGQVIASKDKPEELQDATKLPGWYNSEGFSESEEEKEDSTDDTEANNSQAPNDSDDKDYSVDKVKEAIENQIENPEDKHDIPEVTPEELEELFEKLKCESVEDDVDCDLLVAASTQSDDGDSSSEDCNEREDIEQESTLKNIIQDDDNDGTWITPTNIKKVKKSMEGKTEADFIPVVACMSTDFTVQNTLKQMNLNLCALNGRVIKHLRTYILRCYACFKTTSIMTKVFCPNCGNKTLKRVAVSLDENGKQVIHINTRRPLTKKYKNQSIPRFRGGKHSRNPILFEDQPIPRQMPSRVAKTKTNALEEDYIAGFSPFAMRDVDSKSALLRSKGHVKEWARNNTYEEDRRRKHYNRLYK